MKTFNFFEKLWEHSRTLRRVGLVLVMCLITITQVHAWYVKAYVDGWGGWDTRNIGTGEYTWYNISGGKTFYFIVGNTESNWGVYDIVQNKNTWEDHKSLQASDFGLTSNQMTVALPENSHVTVKYSGSGSDWKVNVYVRPAYYFKYDWNNDGWKWSGWLVRCGDGTYATEGQYRSTCSSFNYDTQDRGSGTGAGSCSNIITDGDNLTSGLKCFFIYNPDGSTRSLTIQEKNSTSGHNYIYFDNTNAGWGDSKIQFVLGHLSYSRTVNMSKVGSSDYTTLYYCDRNGNDWKGDGCFAYFGMIGSSSKFTDGAWASDNMYRATHYSQPLYKHQNLASGYNYVISKADNVNGHPITIEEKGTGYESLNYTQTVKYQLSKNGAAYADMSASDGATPATITASSYRLSDRNSVSGTSLGGALTVNTTTRYSSTITACHTGKTTLTVSNVRPGYKFIGWYEGNTQKSTATSYTYRPTGEATVSARFKKLYAYVEGRFEVRDENGDVLSTASNGDWKTDVRTIPMEYDETNNRFVLHTHSTLTQLKANIGSQGSGKQEPYFFIRTSSSTSSWTDGGQYWAHSTGSSYQNLASRGSKKSCDGSNKAFTFTGSEAGYVVLYCDASDVWYDMEYTVDYKKNGGASGADGSVTGTTTDDNSPYLYNTAVTTVSNDYTNTGYKFKWWNTNYGGTGEDFYVGEKFTISANTNLYAQWESVGSDEEFWVGDNFTFSSDIMSVGDMRVKKNSVDLNQDITKDYNQVSKYSSTAKKAKVLAMDAANEYLEVYFSDGSAINELHLGTVHNDESGTKKVVVIYSTTADFTSGVSEQIEVSIPTCNQSSKSVTDFSPSKEDTYKYARIYRSVSSAVYGSTGPSSGGADKMRIYSIKAQKGTACGSNGLAYETAMVNKTYGDAAFTNTLTNAHSLAVSYSSGDDDVATVNSSNGEVTIKGAGSTTITATWAGSAAYCAGTASYTLNVAKASISPSLSYDETTLTAGDDSSSPTITGNSGNGTVTYVSDDTDVATVDENTGVVTAVAEGTATITATIAATANYNGNTATAEFTVNAACSDPTTTFADSYCNIGSTLDLRTLISSSQGDGTITYAVTDAGGTSASIADGYKFSATAVGTATVTATQAADATNGYCEKVMTAEIVVDPQPSSSVNFEQMVLDNSKKYSYATALSAAHIAYSVGDNPLDSLDESKSSRNEPYLGIKLKPANSYVQVVVPREETLKVKFGHISEKIAYFIDDVKQDSLATSTTVLEVAADASSSHTYKFQLKTKDKTLVIKQIMIGEAIQSVTLPARITMGSPSNGSISVTGTVDGVKVVDVGSTVTVGVSASSGYELTELTYVKTGSGDTPTDITEGDLSEDSYSFDMPNYNVTINATFVLSCSAPGVLSVVPNTGHNGVGSYQYGDDIILTASCADGTDASTTYAWYKGADWATAKAAGAIRSAKTAAAGGTTYTKSAELSDAGTYWCEASNGSGCDTHNLLGTDISVGKAAFTPDLNYESLPIPVGSTRDPVLTDVPDGAGAATYTSSDTDVAEVDSETGVVTAKAAGSATITVSIAESANYIARYDTKLISVREAVLYTVTFDPNGGEIDDSTDPVEMTQATEGAALTMPTPEHATYTFDGWYIADTEIGDEGVYTPTKNVTAYAKWKVSCSGGGSTPVVLFSQNFNSAAEVAYDGGAGLSYSTSNTLTNLVGSGSNLFTSITSVSEQTASGIAINSSTGVSDIDATGLFLVRKKNSAYYWSMTRTADFAATAPTAIAVEMDIYFDNLSSGTSQGVTFAIGDGFEDGLKGNTIPSSSNVHSGFNIMDNSSPKFCQYGSTTTIYSTAITDATWYSIVWVINNTGSTLTYEDPDGSGTSTVNNDCFDIWLKTQAQEKSSFTRIVNNQAATTGSKDLQNIHIGGHGDKQHLLMLDNIVVTDIASAGGSSSGCYRVNYHSNGADGGLTFDPLAYDEGDLATVVANGFTFEHETEFIGWNTAVDGSGTMYRAGDKLSISDDDIELYAQWMPINRFQATEDWLWNNEDNWSHGVLPSASHKVIIEKPCELRSKYGVNPIAKVKTVVIDKYGDNTGRLTIAGPAGLAVEEMIKTKNAEGELVGTSTTDLNIESSSDHENGALAVKGYTEEGGVDLKATVTPKTKARVYGWEIEGEYNGFYVNQYIGTPIRDGNAVRDYYGSWIYRWDATAPEEGYDAGRGDWVFTTGNMTPFQGYTILRDDWDETYLWITGSLVYSESHVFNLAYDANHRDDAGTENMLANSYLAPIDVTTMTTDDFAGGDDTKMEATIYVFNSGTPNNWSDNIKEEGTIGDLPGQYLSMSIESAEYTEGITEISSMQAFSVYTKKEGATFNLDYERMVYNPLKNRDKGIASMRAPGNKAAANDNAPDVMKIMVECEHGADKLFMLTREDFNAGFDNGWDARKMFGESFAPQLYAFTPDGNMSVNCVPDEEGAVLGFRKGSADDVYTISFTYNGEKMLYLNDTKEQLSTLINDDAEYTFVSETGDTEARFIISETPYNAPAVTTGFDGINAEQKAKVHKVLINDHIYIIRGGRMYDATGKMLK